MSYSEGAVAPSTRCCSTDAGSVSPCTVIRRMSSARYSPGTSCQAGSPLCLPNGMTRSGSCSARKMPQRYCSMGTWSKCAQPSRPTAIAVRRYTSLVGSAGPSAFHQSRNFGCHPSSARWSLRSPARFTLFGIRSL
jgi:hypothetical protein